MPAKELNSGTCRAGIVKGASRRDHRRFREYLIGIKGPLTTPIGGGFRSLNVALRQILDLYVCLRPIRWFEGVPSPVKRPDLVDMVIFRENTRTSTPDSSYRRAPPRPSA